MALKSRTMNSKAGFTRTQGNEIEFTAESTVSSNMTIFAAFKTNQSSNAFSSSITIIIVAAIALITAILILYFFYFRKQ